MNTDQPNQNTPDDEIKKESIVLSPNTPIAEPEIDHTILDLPTSLDGISMEDAKDYVASIITTKKQYEKDINAIVNDVEKFYQRKKQINNDPSLERQVDEEIHRLEEKIKQLRVEEMELSVKIELLIAELKKKITIQPEIDSNGLLAALEGLVGKSADEMKLEKDMEALHLQDKLAQLKKKANEENE